MAQAATWAIIGVLVHAGPLVPYADDAFERIIGPAEDAPLNEVAALASLPTSTSSTAVALEQDYHW